ncbi:MAG: CRISPR-associated protein Csx11 [Chloroflexi bacterium]|nr:CRISPR-associated protein Csx11 [Chloroflexota bacterium]
MSQLETLAQHQDAVLLAEAIGWLHDYRKCSDEQLRTQAADKAKNDLGLPRDKLTNKFPALSSATLSIQSTNELLSRLLNDWEPRRHCLTVSFLVLYLSRCHDTAHFDKQEPADSGKQCYPGTQISSAFGYESSVPSDLTTALWGLPWNDLADYSTSKRQSLRASVQQLFSAVGADTRRPINEVSLWDWGVLVGTLFKAAVAGALLGSQPAARDLRWRLLSVRLDGLSYALEALRLPDLLARRKLVTDALNRVREVLEVTYPLGSEVYRDEAGAVFVVPDLPDLLDNFANQHGQSLRQLILQEFAQASPENKSHLQLGGEAMPEVCLDATAWWGQDPDFRTKRESDQSLLDEMPPVGALLAKDITAHPQPAAVQAFWQDRYGEVCTVCGLRPQGPERKAQERSVCDTCEQRRSDRSMNWATGQTVDTIWIDEVSDSNGRVALITGQFELTHWLDAGNQISLVLVAPGNGPTSSSTCAHEVKKSASFSRIRRVWETTRRFWREAQERAGSRLSDDRRRLQIWLDLVPELGDFHVYELELGNTIMSLVWYPATNYGSGGYFVSADNLGYTARQLGADKSIYSDPAAAAIFVEDSIRERFVNGKEKPILRDSEAAGTRKGNLIAGCAIARLEHQDAAYSTTVHILAEPRTFMALVPADKALDIVQMIKTKYDREMGKVRNRLPLRGGIAYFHRHAPLHAALDAGRRMLQQKALGGDHTWTVQADATEETLPNEHHLLADGTQQFRETITVQLEQDGRSISWQVPAVMGDGCTKDIWYPYVFVEANGDDSIRDGRTLAFKGQRPTGSGTTEECWLVHAGQLKAGDQAYFTPATFDFEWLDTTARRFEIAHNEQGKRNGRLTRPYLLDDLDTIRQGWALIAGRDGLTTSQIHALRDTVESRREAWQPSPQEETFRRLCRDAVLNAAWEKRPPSADIDKLVVWATSGVLADVIELYMGIMKEKPQRD